MYVLVYGERVAIPEGWIVVCNGWVKPGDKRLDSLGSWAEFGEWFGGRFIDAIDYALVIRRDPGAEG